MDKQTTFPKPFVFVLMPFDPKFDDIYKFGIKGAADDVGAYAERVDEQIFQDGILDRIFNQISKADVVVADMTGRNSNVFYEVGYAHALGKIVLLLTQDSDDIPFDLKQRQHTIYSGKIEALRVELSTKLEWAIRESQKRSRDNLGEQFSLSIINTEVPEWDWGAKVAFPEIKFDADSSSFRVPIHLRNISLEPSRSISHVYLFLPEDSAFVPGQFSPYQSGYLAGVSFNPLTPFRAASVDAQDGLSMQFRLPIIFPTLPPGAVESDELLLAFRGQPSDRRSVARLRLHSMTRVYDYFFLLEAKVK